jgi:hypothetical protein
MKKISIFVMALVAIALSVITGCQKQANSSVLELTSVDYSIAPYLSKDKQVQEEIQYLVDEDLIKPEQIKDLYWDMPERLADGSKTDSMLQGYSIKGGGDISLGARIQIQEGMKIKAQLTGQESYKHTKRAVMATAGVIKVRMYSSVPLAWKTAVTNACAYWNSKGYTVSFSPYSTTSTSVVNGEVNVVYGAIPNDFTSIVRTNPPSANGNPGLGMTINTNYINTYSDPITSAKKHAITHELGHALGFGHTDLLETGMSWVSNTTLTTACKNNADPSSIMQSTMNSYYAFNGFSTCDGQVFDYFY